MTEDLAGDWRRLDERIEGLSNEIEAIADQDAGCDRLISVPGIGPVISSAIVAAIGTGDVFSKGRDFAAWLGLVPRQISSGDRTILGKICKRLRRYWTTACQDCSLKSQCTTGPKRRILRWEHEHLLQAVQQRLDANPQAMRQRRETVEHPFGTKPAWERHTSSPKRLQK